MKHKQSLMNLLVLVFVISLMPNLFGQSDWTIKNTQNSPLVNNAVVELFQDSEGNVWVGTKNGLNQITENDWMLYSRSSALPHGFINDIVEDNQGNMWIATGKGVAFFNGSNWTHILKEDGIVNNRTYSATVDSKGNVWFGTKKGVSVYDGQKWQTYTMENGLVNNRVIDIMEDAVGNMWFATAKGVSVYDGTDWISYSQKDGLGRNFVWSMDQTSNGTIWFGTHTGVFNSYKGNDWEYYKKGSGYYQVNLALAGFFAGAALSLTLPPVYGSAFFLAYAVLAAFPSSANGTVVFIDSEDNIWLSAQPKGVWKFNGKDWMKYSKENGLPHKRVYDIMQTADGNIWFGTHKGIAILGN